MSKYKSIFLVFVIFLTIQTIIAQVEKPNILLICVDDLRPELASFGASYIKSPNIDKLAKAGRAFQNHYVNAPSCGPSRYTLLTGIYGPPKNNALFLRAEKGRGSNITIKPSMPEWFKKMDILQYQLVKCLTIQVEEEEKIGMMIM